MPQRLLAYLTRACGGALTALLLTGGSASAELQPLSFQFSLEPVGEALDQPGSARLAALEKLSGKGSRAAITVITRWLSDGPALDLEDWLHTARALSPHGRRPAARRWLGKLMSGAPLVDTRDDPELRLLVRATAAVGLARAGDERSLRLLGRALRQTQELAELARGALLAHPPRDLGPILEAPGAATVAYVQTLEELGDQRAFVPLRELVRRGTPELQARATLALFRMGHMETVEVAEHWLKTAPQHPELMRVAGEILLATGSESAPKALETLLALERETALELSLSHPSPALAPSLVAALDKLPTAPRRAALSALGRCGGHAALDALAHELDRGPLRGVAAHALALSGADGAEHVLLSALKSKSARSWAVRALVVRGQQRGERWAQLDSRLEQLRASKDAAERWLGEWGRAASSADVATELLASDQPLQVAAATATVLHHPKHVARAAAQRLNRRPENSAIVAALLPTLATVAGRDALATTTVHAMLSDDAQPIAVAHVLASRSNDPRPAIAEGLLTSTDVAVRSAALRALGDNPEPASLGRLRRAYRSEVDARVRRAAIEALSRRPRGAARDRLLQWAQHYDPDGGVRHLARLGQSAALRADLRGGAVAWVELPQAAGQVVQLVDSSGLALPILVPPDGVLVVLGFAETPFDLRWAPRT